MKIDQIAVVQAEHRAEHVQKADEYGRVEAGEVGVEGDTLIRSGNY